MDIRSTVLGAVLGGGAVAVAWLATSWLTFADKPNSPILRGEFRVNVTVATASGTSGSEFGATAIEFHPQYVLVKYEDGGDLYPLDRIRYFSWRVDHEAERRAKKGK